MSEALAASAALPASAPQPPRLLEQEMGRSSWIRAFATAAAERFAELDRTAPHA